MAKKKAKAAGTAPPTESSRFFPDTETTPGEKNARLADLLRATSVGDLAIVSIKRLEIGNTGWLVTFRR
jgi:hypothetical protein